MSIVDHDKSWDLGLLAIYGPMIYTIPPRMLLMRANPLRGQRALEIETFLGPVKWQRAVIGAISQSPKQSSI
jgi:hypothetical protein